MYPSGYKGKRPAGSYEGLIAAYNTAQPGDILLVHKGVYRGSYTLTRSGTPGKPIVLRGAGDGEVVFHGDGHQTDLFNVETAGHLMFEGLTLRHAKHAILGGTKGSPGAQGLTVRAVPCFRRDLRRYHCFRELARLVHCGQYSDWHQHDVVSAAPRLHRPATRSERVRPRKCRLPEFYNPVQRRDRTGKLRPPPGDLEKQPVALDIYDNDVSWAQDDCIETDYGAHNFRVYRNRCYNAHTGISAQPFYGGPVYLVRNEIYGVTALIQAA